MASQAASTDLPAGDVAAYDKIHEHILMLSDGLTQGIVNQFPDQFTA